MAPTAKDVVREMSEKFDSFSVTAMKDGYIEIKALEEKGDAIDIKELNHWMAKQGYWLAYSIPETRCFQYINSRYNEL